ncbi:MAG TPA: hypothetical protein VLA67_06515 [Nitrospiraceae bacterium]|nr:hypothetical protein [Nitrospiraceae bacterium]
MEKWWLAGYFTVCLLLFLLLPVGAFTSFIGPSVSVLDGDTIEVLHNLVLTPRVKRQ